MAGKRDTLKGCERLSREIKFRAWDEVAKKWLWITGFETKETSKGNGYTLGGLFHDGDYVGHENIKVIQYTGLKDKNGREIYESDIVQYTRIVYADCSRTEIEDIEELVIGEVYYAEGLWIGFRFIDGTGKLFLPGQVSSEDNNPEIEVIGNIYENPELLNEK